MAAPPAPRPDQPAAEARLHQLARDGYVELTGRAWLLTEKGWRTLSAAATPPPRPIKQSKTEIECELRKWVSGVLGVTSWTSILK